MFGDGAFGGSEDSNLFMFFALMLTSFAQCFS